MVRPGLLAATAVLALGLASCNTSNNYFAEEQVDTGPQRTNAFTALLTMGGLAEKSQEPISYQPRAPLAMPGSSDLPSPDSVDDAREAVNFPVDYDERRRAERNAQIRSANALDDELEDGQRRLLPGELNSATARAGKRSGGVDMSNHTQTMDPRLTPNQMQVTHKSPSGPGNLMTEDGKAAPRMSLIQPPDAYRTAADTSPLPEKGDIENSEWANKRLYRNSSTRSVDPKNMMHAPGR